ncbi:carbohydrate porin [Luteolibacter sp. LG18]|uniref:carbohydrate porin n=1 Tax=Luteolibacter sp. LG18 TaxID=2819286 RepID=UPI002B2FBB6C|nr:porin [Luteolibacter sp. LG18]
MKKHILFPLLLSTGLASGEEASWLEGNQLSGDWHGVRTRLKDSGVTVFANYNAIVAANVSGGLKDDEAFAGDLYAGVKFDLEKILGWDDTVFTISGVERHGRSVDRAVGGQYSVMQLVGGQTAFLYELNLEKKFLDDTLSVKLGRMSATDDFVGSPYYSYSLNNAVDGQIRAVLFDGVMTSYPFPVWGGRVKYEPCDEFYVSVGAYQLSDNIFDPKDHGVDFNIRGDDGISIFTQVGWNPVFDGRPAHFFAGMNNAFHRIDQFNTAQDTHHFTRFYGHGDYQVYSETPGSDQGLVVFATLAYTAREEVAIMPVQSTLGLHYKGLFPGRDNDRTVFFATYGGFSDDYAAQQLAVGMGKPEYEMVLEAGHRFQITPALYAQPDIQYIIRPGGTGKVDNALVLGMQFGATF